MELLFSVQVPESDTRSHAKPQERRVRQQKVATSTVEDVVKQGFQGIVETSSDITDVLVISTSVRLETSIIQWNTPLLLCADRMKGQCLSKNFLSSDAM